jgi:hypothetical protein
MFTTNDIKRARKSINVGYIVDASNDMDMFCLEESFIRVDGATVNGRTVYSSHVSGKLYTAAELARHINRKYSDAIVEVF